MLAFVPFLPNDEILFGFVRSVDIKAKQTGLRLVPLQVVHLSHGAMELEFFNYLTGVDVVYVSGAILTPDEGDLPVGGSLHYGDPLSPRRHVPMRSLGLWEEYFLTVRLGRRIVAAIPWDKDVWLQDVAGLPANFKEPDVVSRRCEAVDPVLACIWMIGPGLFLTRPTRVRCHYASNEPPRFNSYARGVYLEIHLSRPGTSSNTLAHLKPHPYLGPSNHRTMEANSTHRYKRPPAAQTAHKLHLIHRTQYTRAMKGDGSALWRPSVSCSRPS